MKFNCRHKLITALMASVLMLLVLSISSQMPVMADSYQTVSTTKVASTAYHRASSAGALYNLAHTKKLHLLKNYPYTTWYVTQQLVLKHDNKSAIYYQVNNASGTCGTTI